MILPQDTKEAIYSDDEDDYIYADYNEYDDFSSDEDDHDERYTRPMYPNEPFSSQYPLLFDSDDIELGPAPPYSTLSPPPFSPTFLRAHHHSSLPSSSRKRNTRLWNWRRLLGVVLAGGCVWTLVVMGLMRWMAGHRRHFRQPPPSAEFSSDFMQVGQSDDGHFVECVDWTGDWTRFPVGDDQPHLPNPPESNEQRWSSNRTLLLPLSHIALFTHMVGPVAIGDIFVDTYDGSSTEMFDLDRQYSSTQHQDELRQGGYIRVVVEPIITALMDEDIEDSVGRHELQLSKICLMQRSRNDTDIQRRDGPPSGPGGPPASNHGEPALGIGIYTEELPNRPEHPHNPLQFRIHLFLPTASGIDLSPPSLAQDLLDALSGNHHTQPPSHHIRSLEIRSGAGGVYLSDLEEALLEELRIDNAVGEIEAQRLRVENLWMINTGRVSGLVEVSNSLDVNTPTGEIDLNITLAARPSFSMAPPPDSAGHAGGNQPVVVSVRSGSGTTRLKYTDWEDSCRTLHQNIFSLTGTVEVHSHPLFEGPFQLSSSLGEIIVDLPETPTPDPLDQGRQRTISLEKHNRLGSKLYQGEVSWSESTIAKEESLSTNGKAMEGVSREQPKLNPGMEIKSSMGTIHVVF